MANVRGVVVGVDQGPGGEQREPFQATLIQLGGTVHGSKGRGYLYYLPLGGGTPGQAWNMARVQERAGVPVWVGFFQNEPVIMHIDKSRMEPNGARGYRSPLFAQHAPDHRWSSGDPLYVDSRQIEDLMVRPAGLLKVRVNPGHYDNGLTYAYYAGTASYDLAGYQPAAGTKGGVGLYLDSAGALQAVAGGVVARTATLPEPSWPAGVFRLALVIVFGDKAFVDFEYIKQRKALYSNPARKVSQLVAADGDPDPAWSVDNAGGLSNPGGGGLDLGGVADALVLDADGDSSISSPTDDQIDFEAGGADIARITAAGLTMVAGLITHAKGVAAYHSTTQTLNNANAANVMALDSERRDDAAFHDTSTDNSRLTVPTGYDGWYVIQGTGGFSADSTGSYRQIAIRIDGTTAIAQNQQPAPGTAQVLRINITAVYYLTAGQYVELVMSHNATTNLTSVAGANSTTEFRMLRVG